MSCLFCAIAAGDIPSRRVHEDEAAVAFLDLQPWHRGHTLVIPRRHVDDLIHGDPVLTELAPAIEVTARLLVDRLGADGLNVLSSAGSTAGQEIFHAHVHLIPRYTDAAGLRQLITPHDADDAELDAVHAELIR